MKRPAFHLADLCCLAYLSVGAVLLLTAGGLALGLRAFFYLLACAAIVLFLGLPDTVRNTMLWRVVATLYPVLLVAVAWGELRLLIPLVWGDNFWATAWAVRTDVALFGGHPTAMVRSLQRAWLDELIAIVYMSYYLFLSVPLILLVLGRTAAARAAASVIAFTYTVNFGIFILLPVKSPPQILDTYPELLPGEFTGWIAAAALRALQGSESVTGAAFPSSHVAGSIACALAALRWAPALGRVLLPLGLGVALATVYLGYHHAIDPVAGIVWGVTAWIVASFWMRRRGELPPERP